MRTEAAAPSIETLKERIALLERQLAERQRATPAPAPPSRHHDMIFQVVDGDGRLSQVSHAWLKLFGYEEEEVLGRSLADFLPEGQAERFLQHFPGMKSVGEALGDVFALRKKDGGERTVSLNGWIERDEEGNFLRSHCILQDVSPGSRGWRRSGSGSVSCSASAIRQPTCGP